MHAEIFDGKAFAQTILERVAAQVAKLDLPPVLAIVLVGENPSSISYIKQKMKSAVVCGVQSSIFHFSETITESDLLSALKDIQQGRRGEWQQQLISDDIATAPVSFQTPDGIIVQRPLPNHINYKNVLNAIEPAKDVDGFREDSPFLAPIGLAVWEILQEMQVTNKEVMLLGYGDTAGKPIAKALASKGIIAEVIRKETPNQAELTQQAEVVISAIGKPGIVKHNWIKPGASVIDVGITRVSIKQPDDTVKYKLAGDCDPEVSEIAQVITPVPGGVGPVNVACLMLNVAEAAAKH